MTTLVPLSGFLGAGKTSTIAALARLLEARGQRVAIVTNDQGDRLVDTLVARTAADDVAEVTCGCFCCRFDDLAVVVTAAVERGADVVLAEAVGSCTDLQATVVRPLRARHGAALRVAPLAAVVDPDRHAELDRSLALTHAGSDLAYLYDRQLADADVIAINKIDTAAPAQVGAVRTDIARRHPDARVLAYSAATGDGLDALAELLADDAGRAGEHRGRDLEIDYDRYAAAEAQLAWLNHTITLTGDNVATALWGSTLLTSLGGAALRQGWTIGHAKVAVCAAGRITKLSLVAADRPPRLDLDAGPSSNPTTATINARVGCRPADLDVAVLAAIDAADAATGAVSATVGPPASFAPAYPTPTHRLPAVGPFNRSATVEPAAPTVRAGLTSRRPADSCPFFTAGDGDATQTRPTAADR